MRETELFPKIKRAALGKKDLKAASVLLPWKTINKNHKWLVCNESGLWCSFEIGFEPMHILEGDKGERMWCHKMSGSIYIGEPQPHIKLPRTKNWASKKYRRPERGK